MCYICITDLETPAFIPTRLPGPTDRSFLVCGRHTVRSGAEWHCDSCFYLAHSRGPGTLLAESLRSFPDRSGKWKRLRRLCSQGRDQAPQWEKKGERKTKKQNKTKKTASQAILQQGRDFCIKNVRSWPYDA